MAPTASRFDPTECFKSPGEAGQVYLRNRDTGYGFYVPMSSLETEKSSELRRRVKLGGK